MRPIRLFVGITPGQLSVHLAAGDDSAAALAAIERDAGPGRYAPAGSITPEQLADIIGVDALDPINAAAALRFVAREYARTPAEKRTLTVVARRIEEDFFDGALGNVENDGDEP